MKDDDVLTSLFSVFLLTAFFSIGGGSALIPEFHRQIVDIHGFMDGPHFAKAVALAQVAPGPNMMLVSLIGWQVAGLPGLLVTTFAIVVPPSLLAYAVWRGMERVQDHPLLKIIKSALGPVVIGLTLASGIITAQAADHDAVGWALTIATAGLMTFTKRNPLWAIGAGAIVGIIAYRMGFMTLV